MLVGIVAMQIEVLKLGASTGRSIDRASALQSRNELLRASVASLADDQRIERLAAGLGMVMPAPAEVGFLTRRAGDAARAARSIHAPDPTTFLASLSALAASATQTPGVATSTATTATSTATTPTSTATTAMSTATTPMSTATTPTSTATTPTSTATTPTGG
jgi:hypothetical protein